MTNYYKILGVRNFASPEEIKTAYRKLSKKFHPDVNDGDTFFEERFKEIQEAYECLSDKRLKKILDESLQADTHTQADYSFTESPKPTAENSGERKTAPAGNDAPTQNKTKKGLSRSGAIAVLCVVAILTILFFVQQKRENKEAVDENQTADRPREITPSRSEEVTYQGPVEKTIYNNTGLFFSIGSTKKEVLAAQGSPGSVNNYGYGAGEVWDYVNSSITFKNGRVIDFSNRDRNLQVKMKAEKIVESDNDYYTIGSSKNEVLQLQGNPTSINNYGYGAGEVWDYGNNSTTFKKGRITDYSNRNGNLRIRMMVSQNAARTNDFFSIGSTKDAVLPLQGTPTSINNYGYGAGEVWDYGNSSITLKNGVVTDYSNRSTNLNVQ